MTDVELDEDVGDIEYSLDHYYRDEAGSASVSCRPGLDGALRAIFEDLGPTDGRAGRAARARAER